MDTFYRTQTIPVHAVIEQDDAVADPTSITCTIVDPRDTSVVDAQDMDKDGDNTGIYNYRYTAAADAQLGEYHIIVTATKSSHVTVAKSQFILEAQFT